MCVLSPSLASLGAQQSSECQGDERGKTTRLTLQLLAMQQAMWSELQVPGRLHPDANVASEKVAGVENVA